MSSHHISHSKAVGRQSRSLRYSCMCRDPEENFQGNRDHIIIFRCIEGEKRKRNNPGFFDIGTEYIQYRSALPFDQLLLST